MCNNSCSYGLLSGPEGSKNVLGHYAVSRCGHDSGKIYLVTGTMKSGEGAELLLLCDGKRRPVTKPKAKKPKHLTLLPERDDEIAKLLLEGRRVDDSLIIHSLKRVRQDLNCDL